MTARAETEVQVDAATVYAEGVLAGLRTACNLIGGRDSSLIPPQLHQQVRVWRANVYHNAWLAEQGRAVPLQQLPDRGQLMSRLHLFLLSFPEFDHVD